MLKEHDSLSKCNLVPKENGGSCAGHFEEGPGKVPEEQRWSSGESACLPLMWSGFVGCFPCFEGLFLWVLRFLILPQKPTFLNYNLIWNLRATSLSVARLSCVTVVKQSRFIFLSAFELIFLFLHLP